MFSPFLFICRSPYQSQFSRTHLSGTTSQKFLFYIFFFFLLNLQRNLPLFEDIDNALKVYTYSVNLSLHCETCHRRKSQYTFKSKFVSRFSFNYFRVVSARLFKRDSLVYIVWTGIRVLLYIILIFENALKFLNYCISR